MADNASSNCGYDEFLGYVGIPISCFVICDSVLTILTIWRSPQLYTNQYIFIASLAVADIILSLSFVATACIRQNWINSILDDKNIINNLTYGTVFSFIVLSGLHMSIIAVDRYIRVAYPFYYITNMTKQRTMKVLLFIYVLGFINACIPAIVYQDFEFNNCINIHQPFGYFYPNFGILIISVQVDIFCYFKIARIAVSHKKAAISRRLKTGQGNVIINSNRTTVMKSVRFFVAMCGVYFIMCMPPFVLNFIEFYHSLPDFVIAIGGQCFPLHSVLNFIICCSMNKAFFKAFKKTFADAKSLCFHNSRAFLV